MPDTNIAFCENSNSNCRVVIYLVGPANCPGCGRFGRLKDDAPTPDHTDLRDRP